MVGSPSISVCLATYNGQYYVVEAIESILNQLEESDELIIYDDCSTDATLSLIRVIESPQIRFFENESNLGHVMNFQKAIKQARCDIILLADQDDVWCYEKIKIVRKHFKKHPDTTLYIHSNSCIDGNGIDLAKLHLYPDAFVNRAKFILFEFIRPSVKGCCISFPSSLRRFLVPFPKFVYAHDHFLSCALSILGPVRLSSSILLKYRIHSTNVTPRGGLPLKRKIAVRLKYMGFIGVSLYRKFFNR